MNAKTLCKTWQALRKAGVRWVPWMASEWGWRFVEEDEDGCEHWSIDGRGAAVFYPDQVEKTRLPPDLDDGPTVRGLLEELRRLTGERGAHTEWDERHECWRAYAGWIAELGETEGEAVFWALCEVCKVKVEKEEP